MTSQSSFLMKLRVSGCFRVEGGKQVYVLLISGGESTHSLVKTSLSICTRMGRFCRSL